MTISVWSSQYKPWVRQLVAPYVSAFGIGCIVSVAAIAQKMRLVLRKNQSRNAAAHNGPLDLDGVEVPVGMAQNEALKALKRKFDMNKLATRKMYCAVALGVFEGAWLSLLRP